MRKSKWSESIETHKGKKYQAVSLRVSITFVDCPYCSYSMDTHVEHNVVECETCKKEFYVKGLDY